MQKFISFLIILFTLAPTLAAQEKTDTITIFMIGDSTMANKSLAKQNQERGWGQMLPLFMQGTIKVDNHAVNGRSSKSFIDEGRWDAVRERIRPGDYVIIQFGHNDEKANSPERYTLPGLTFDANLKKFVIETREKGGTPILMNSIVRRNFPLSDEKAKDTDDSKISWKEGSLKSKAEGETLVDTHGDYIIAPRNVAEELDVIFIDMNALTHELVQDMGRDASRELFMWIPAGKYEFAPDGRLDNTHLNIPGALLVARIGASALASHVPSLRPYITPLITN